jgi:DNA-binding GntR family transcriptional regulator
VTSINRQSRLPIYVQIAVDIRRRIAEGEWAAGQRIDPELSLAREYQVGRMTIRQALAELVKDDLLERQRGSGTYVRHGERPLVYDLNFTIAAVAEKLQKSGFENRAEVLEVGIVNLPSDAVQSELELGPDEPAVFMVRRILIDGKPTAIYRSWFPAALVPDLERSPRLSESLSIVVGEDYGLIPARSENEIEVVRSTREEATLLGASADVPLLVVTATTFLADGRPLERSQIVWLGDRVRFHVTAHQAGDGRASLRYDASRRIVSART